MSCLEFHRGTLEGVPMLADWYLRRRCLEDPTDVRQHGLEQRPVVRAEVVRLSEFLVEVAQGLLEFAHGASVCSVMRATV
jgi:hypothetical protein